jgi:hypothetical protein
MFTKVNAPITLGRMAPAEAKGKRSADDRAEAPGWYARLKLRQRMAELEIRPAKIAEDSGVPDPTVSTCLKEGKGVGLLQLLRFAEYLKVPPGQFLEDALLWWEKHGRAEAQAVRIRLARGEKEPLPDVTHGAEPDEGASGDDFRRSGPLADRVHLPKTALTRTGKSKVARPADVAPRTRKQTHRA